MKRKTYKGLFTIIYPFMHSDLHLTGLAKECFAVIFGFWFFQGEHPVGVSLTIMQTLTGGTRSSVVQAIHKLEESQYIAAHRQTTKKTMYVVTISEQVLANFKSIYDNSLVLPLNHQRYSEHTSASPPTTRQNKIKDKYKSDITPLRVKNAREINTGGLKEA